VRGGINARGAAVGTGCPSRALPVSCFPSLLSLLSLLFLVSLLYRRGKVTVHWFSFLVKLNQWIVIAT
jgi:hypothetical protein